MAEKIERTVDMSDDTFKELSKVLRGSGLETARNANAAVYKKNQVRFSRRVREIPEKPQDQPGVEPISEGGYVVGMRVTCACGQVTTVYFDYEGNPADSFAAAEE